MNILCLDFIHTSWFATHRECQEILSDNNYLLEFMNKRNLNIATPPTTEEFEELLKLRALLYNTLEGIIINGDITNINLETINFYLSLSTLERYAEFTDKKSEIKLRLRPTVPDWRWIYSEIAASFIDLISNYDITRLRMCENPECRWFFYDGSKSRTKRWCDETCGNLMKVRRFRAKKKVRES